MNRLRNSFLSDITPNVELAAEAGVATKEELYALRSADFNTLTEPQQLVVKKMREEEAAMIQKIIKEGKKWKVLSDEQAAIYTDDFLDKWKFIDPERVDAEFTEIIAKILLERKSGQTVSQRIRKIKGKGQEDLERAAHEEAVKFVDDYRRNPNSVAHIEFLESVGAFESPQFGKYQNHDPRYNAVMLAGNLSSHIAQTGMYGQQDEALAKILYSMKQRGVSEERVADTARKLNTLRQAQRGEYKRPEGTGMNVYHFFQDNALLASQWTMMDANIFANLADIMYNSMRLKPGEIKEYVSRFARSFAVAQGANYRHLGNSEKRLLSQREDEGLQLLTQTGHLSDIDEIVQIEGTDVNKKWAHGLSSALYRINLVGAFNDATRSAAAQGAISDILGLAKLVAEKPNTKAGRQASRRLTNYNISPETVVQLVNNPEVEAILSDPRMIGGFDDFMLILKERGLDGDLNPDEAFDIDLKLGRDTRELFENLRDFYNLAVANYVDEFAARPEKGTGSLAQEDPRLRFFTQYTRFIFHFSTNQLPTLWNLYIQRGSPTMHYKIFANIAMTMMIATFGQYMKMMMQYGEIPEWFEDEDEDFFQSFLYHGVTYAGYGGTPEWAFDKLLRYQENEWRADPETIFPEQLGYSILGLSPALSQIEQGYRKAQEGQFTEWAEKKIPFYGDYTRRLEGDENTRDFLGSRI